MNVAPALVDDRVQRDGRLTGRAVADDQLALAAPDRDHRVDGLETGHQRLADLLAVDDARSLDLDATAVIGNDRPLAVDRVPDGIDNASEERVADRNVRDAGGPLDDVAFLNVGVLTQDDDADVVLFQVQNHPHDA